MKIGVGLAAMIVFIALYGWLVPSVIEVGKSAAAISRPVAEEIAPATAGLPEQPRTGQVVIGLASSCSVGDSACR